MHVTEALRSIRSVLMDRKMLVDMTFKRAVDFHGHMCPELVIGAKVCEYAQKLLKQRGEAEESVWIVAENCTSAIDAIQTLMGLTLGNQRLQIIDFGKHNYTIGIQRKKEGFRLSFKGQVFGDEEEYGALEEKIVQGRITMDEVVRFQEMVDGRTRALIGRSSESLFDVEPVGPMQPCTEPALVYLTCRGCGQPVIKSRAIDDNGSMYCIPCFRQHRLVCAHSGLH